MHVIAIRCAEGTRHLYYRGGVNCGVDLWTFDRNDAAHYRTEDAARQVTRNLTRWHDVDEDRRSILRVA